MKLLIVSHVWPFPRAAGQNQRVYYTLRGLRPKFQTTFLTFAPQREIEATKAQLLEHVDEAIVLPSLHQGRLGQKLGGAWHLAATGLKASNYVIGEIEFAPERIQQAIDPSQYDLALFEYWHAWKLAKAWRGKVPTVLDMHDILWRSYERQLAENSRLPAFWKNFALKRYQKAEEASWKVFDALIAINREEEQEAKQIVPETTRMFYAPMGTDLSIWPYSPNRANPPRLAFYGGMGTSRNQEFARQCVERIMPIVWQKHPNCEFWIVGSKPPESILKLQNDQRVKVTGYVESVQAILGTMTAILCPWNGTFGFRSRLIEVMALGVPVTANPDAVAGMELQNGAGLLLGQNDSDLAQHACRLLEDPEFAQNQGLLARRQMEALYGFDATYGRLTGELAAWVN